MLMKKKCKECGLEFETTNGNKKFCDRKHYRKCVVCGKEFEVTRYHLTAPDAKTTCSRKCSSELRKRTNIEKYGGVAPACSADVREKMQSTNKERYGTAHAAQSEIFKEKTRETNLKRYGVEYYTQTAESKAKMSATWADSEYKKRVQASRESTYLKKYKVKNPMQSAEIRDKLRKAYQEKTGYSTPFSNPDVQAKIESTNLSKYGVRRPLQNLDIRDKWKLTNKRLYGYENPMQNSEVLRKAQATCFERYGNTCYLQSELGRSQTRSSMRDKYSVDYFSQSADWKSSRMLDSSKVDELIAFRESPESYLESHFDSSPSIRELANTLGIHENTAGQLILEFKLQDKIDYVYSYMESEVYSALLEIDSGLTIERNTHKYITPYELDLYLPDYRIGIECNPTATHNSSINVFDATKDAVPYSYHQMKTDLCEREGIFLFHIFGSEWMYSRDIIISMMRNLLGKNSSKIYARKCEVREITSEESRDFLNNNHRQGNANAKIRLGLFYEDELVSVMTFGKMRSSIGTGNEDLENCYELVRFCSKLNTNVVGGAGKLFKAFIKKYNPERIRSFSDRAHTRGTLYEKLGFNEVRRSDPGYVWVDMCTDISYHRYCAQKQNIKQFLHDDTIDLNKTEREIMIEHGFLQVYDSGTITWEWIKN